MATIPYPGQLLGFLPYGLSSFTQNPMRTPPRGLNFYGRFMGSMIVLGGDKTLSGITKVGGAPAPRKVIIVTQPPHAQVVFEGDSDRVTGAFAFPRLAPGKYLVIDTAPEGSQALVYDWTVPV